MSLLGWSFFGFTLGVIFRSLFLRQDRLGLVGLCVLGVMGALLGGALGVALRLYSPDEGAGFISAVLGSSAVLSLYTVTIARKASQRQAQLSRRVESKNRAA